MYTLFHIQAIHKKGIQNWWKILYLVGFISIEGLYLFKEVLSVQRTVTKVGREKALVSHVKTKTDPQFKGRHLLPLYNIIRSQVFKFFVVLIC